MIRTTGVSICWKFQSTPPARGATAQLRGQGLLILISIHAPREGGDFCPTVVPLGAPVFQSTPPARGATRQDRRHGGLVDISIHAPREGGDYRMEYEALEKNEISIHAPREGGDDSAIFGLRQMNRFQSTPPARGATAKMHSFTCGSLTNK